MNSQGVIYTEDFLAMDSQTEVKERLFSAFQAVTGSEDSEYTWVGRQLSKAGNATKSRWHKIVGAVSGGADAAESMNKSDRQVIEAKANRDGKKLEYEVTRGSSGNNKKLAKELTINAAVAKHAEASRLQRRQNRAVNMSGGGAIGAVAGAGVGLAISNHKNKAHKAEIDELESKGNHSPNQAARLAALKKKVARNNAIGGIVGGVAGAGLGVAAGHLRAKGLNGKVDAAHAAERSKAEKAYKKIIGKKKSK